jgi:hypothetical protein
VETPGAFLFSGDGKSTSLFARGNFEDSGSSGLEKETLNVRGQPLLVDFDLANHFQVTTVQLNQQV